ncbi:MAG TPA: hypothetical protein VM869_19855 [Enhygromyxa sp.]|nr:hypothetical protein [Enhygromyxa sp.]
MDKLEQLASAHESISELLHAIDPLVLIGIVCAQAGIPAPTIIEVRYRNPRIEIPGLAKPARKGIVDLVYTTLSAEGRLEVWIIEIELSWDWLKVRRWAFYELSFENELEADAARLAVFSPEPELRGKIHDKILPNIKTKPVLIQPDQIERITDYREARRSPELTILGCLFHAHPPSPFEARVAVFRAAWMAIQSLAENKARRYSVAVMSIVPEAVVEQGVAELRETGELDESRWELFTDSERKGHSFARGHREGLAEGLRRAVLDTLELRGIEVTEVARERVETCASVEQLERWYAAAKSASNDSWLVE